jgi:hypothetical protein
MRFDSSYPDMKLLHNIGVSPSSDPRISSNYNTREEILACDEPLSFDGVYLNVWENRDVLKGKDVTLFFMGDYVGKDNSFDVGMPPERYCDWTQIMDLAMDYGCKLGWHTWSHRDLTTLSREEIIKELTPPFPMASVAHPYGRFNADVKSVAELFFHDGWSVTQGDGTQFAKVRTYLNK